MAKKVVDVFSGIGGLSLGFEAGAGHETVMAMEMEEPQARVFAANHPKAAVMLGDCTKSDPAAMKKILGGADAVIGGVPCEPFSAARTTGGSGKEDPRRNLINYALKLVGAFEPQVFCFENVWRAPNSPSWKRAAKAMERAGYGVAVWKLNAADYGTPQTRKRAFFVGAKGVATDAMKPPEATTTKYKTAGEAFKGLGEPSEGGKDPLHVAYPVNPDTKAGRAIKRAKPGDSLDKYTDDGSFFTYAVLSADIPSRTIIANPSLAHWNKKRWLSPREMTRLQEIPDDYKFPIPVNRARGVIGDCVPVGLGAAVAKQLTSLVTKADASVDSELLSKALADVEAAVYTCDELERPDFALSTHSVQVEKESDPYLEVPPEDKKYKFSVQQHWRGKSVHSDVRIAHHPGKLLIGWTLNTQIKGAVKEPVVTLAEAQRLSSSANIGKVSKINWSTGEWARRPKAGTDKLVRTEILTERKATSPHAWLEVEGKTKDPEPGKAPPVGGTKQFPGVFDIVDQGTVEFGAQKPGFHEYFFHGGGFNYRVFFRQLKISKAAGEGKCEACATGDGALELGWTGSDTAKFCEPCAKDFVGKADAVLPPSEEQAMSEGLAWLAIYPGDQQPYVLGPDTVKKGWMPPDGRSALPAAIRSQVPEEFQYWRKTGDAARQARDALVEALKAKKVELNYDVPFKKSEEEASLYDAGFVLQEQTRKTDATWWVRLDVGRRELVTLKLQGNPLNVEKVAAEVGSDRHKDSMTLSGEIPAGHYLNPAKDAPSSVEPLDSGQAEVLSLTDDLVKVRFSGEELKGVYEAKRDGSEWTWQPGKEAPKLRFTEKRMEFNLTIPFDRVEIKKNAKGEEKRLVTGVVLEPDEVDAQDDWEKVETIERAAHLFLANYNKSPDDGGTQLGVMHKVFGDIGVELVECYVAPAAFKLGKKKVKKGSWIVTVHISSDKRWEEVKSGKLNGFSVGGVATVAGN